MRRYFAKRAPAGDVDDLVQDVFLQFQACRAKTAIACDEAYLFAVARNVLVSRRRSQNARYAGLLIALEDAPEPANDLSPERILAARQDYHRVLEAVQKLPPRTRAAFQFHRFEELTYAAIAERMSISRDSVKELLRRATDRLRMAADFSLKPTPPYANL